MLPDIKSVGTDNGVGQVLVNYHKYLPQVGIEVTTDIADNYDISASHLGYKPDADVFFNHGFWWGNVNQNMQSQNQTLIQSALQAKAVIVPSNYVAEIFKRDFRITPFVIGHAVEFDQWQGAKNSGYILWNKNRPGDVCSPLPLYQLAEKHPDKQFVSTFIPMDKKPLSNIKVTGKLSFDKMQKLIKGASVYISTAKETFSIGVLEALACGIPVLAYNWGNVPEIITHKEDGYLVNPNEDLSEGLEWLLQNRSQLTENCKQTASKYNWLTVAQQIKEVCEYVTN